MGKVLNEYREKIQAKLPPHFWLLNWWLMFDHGAYLLGVRVDTSEGPKFLRVPIGEFDAAEVAKQMEALVGARHGT